jgi:hypothetical protein
VVAQSPTDARGVPPVRDGVALEPGSVPLDEVLEVVAFTCASRLAFSFRARSLARSIFVMRIVGRDEAVNAAHPPIVLCGASVPGTTSWCEPWLSSYSNSMYSMASDPSLRNLHVQVSLESESCLKLTDTPSETEPNGPHVDSARTLRKNRPHSSAVAITTQRQMQQDVFDGERFADVMS